MNKSKLVKFIEKYNLGGKVESVKWTVGSEVLKTDFVSADKSVIGFVNLKKFSMEDADFGIYTTCDLLKMLSALSDDIKITPKKVADKMVALKLTDSSFDMNYVLADLAIIPKAANIKTLPEFEIELKVDSDFIDKFVKAKGAITDSTKVAFNSMGNEVVITMGYSDQNTNRVVYNISGKNTADIGPKLFDAETLKLILTANKDCEKGVIKISNKGLIQAHFENGDFESNYYMVEIQNIG